MFSFFYDLALFLLGLVALPKILWQRVRHGKYKSSMSSRFGFDLPDVALKDKVIWIHTISFGETRAVLPLFKKIRSSYPDATILISSITETGHAEAKKSMKEADGHFFLPLDFSPIIKKALKKYRPNVLLLVESDFWYNLLHFAKKDKAKILLVNGKISERSLQRFETFSFLSERLFSLFDHFCLQSKRYSDRFVRLPIPPEKISVTGNIKLDASPKILTDEEKKQWKEDLGINAQDKVLVIGSTHEPEEEQILTAIAPIWKEIPELKILLVPRHPERFARVKEILASKNISNISYSERAIKKGNERVVLIDAMGILNSCYQLADVALVAGSFTDRVGGHNIFEPVVFGVPVLYGPYMRTQLDLVELLKNAGVGQQVTLEELPRAILSLLQDQKNHQKMKEICLAVSQEAKGSTDRTWKMIQSYFED
jgi:3-deoxy-D-manno-octulosonic-acid transferase